MDVKVVKKQFCSIVTKVKVDQNEFPCIWDIYNQKKTDGIMLKTTKDLLKYIKTPIKNQKKLMV